MPRLFVATVYINAFLTGCIIMAFEMVGSRYLSPYFGSGIYTWAALISTVMIAMMIGYYGGGWIADRAPRPAVLGGIIASSSVFFMLVPAFHQPVFDLIFDSVASVAVGSLLAAAVLNIPPLALLSAYTPFAIRLILRSTTVSGSTAGRIYSISTLGSIVGTLGATFVLIPNIGTTAITHALAAAALVAGGLMLRSGRLIGTAALGLGTAALVIMAPGPAGAACGDPPLRDDALAALPDGTLAEHESEYHRTFITKESDKIFMRFRRRGVDYGQSARRLSDPDSFVFDYARLFSVAPVYVPNPARILVIGLGGGTTSRYLARHIPDVDFDLVEVDPGIVACAETYFGVERSDRYRIHVADGRVFLRRAGDTKYDVIYVDAFRAGYIPFHLLTREFYRLLRDRLTIRGAVLFNLHNGNDLFLRSLRTVADSFDNFDVYSLGRTSVVVGYFGRKKPWDTLRNTARWAQQHYGFSNPLPHVISTYETVDPSRYNRQAALTDDFAPVNILQTIERENRLGRIDKP